MTKSLAARQREVFGGEKGRDRGQRRLGGKWGQLTKDLGNYGKELHPERAGEPGRV